MNSTSLFNTTFSLFNTTSYAILFKTFEENLFNLLSYWFQAFTGFSVIYILFYVNNLERNVSFLQKDIMILERCIESLNSRLEDLEEETSEETTIEDDREGTEDHEGSDYVPNGSSDDEDPSE